jgi:hypothetical protein
LISQDPGHRFGNPFDYYDAFDEHDGNDDDAEEEEYITTLEGEAIETEVCQQALMHQQGDGNNLNNKDSNIGTQQNLLQLYYCHYPVSAKPIDSKIQRTGWKVDSHGCAPSPKCRWMPTSPADPNKPNYPHQALREKTNVSSKPKRGSPTSVFTTIESAAAQY